MWKIKKKTHINAKANIIKTCRPTTQNMSFQKAAQKVGPIKFTDYMVIIKISTVTIFLALKEKWVYMTVAL